jgi:hypothetical protein
MSLGFPTGSAAGSSALIACRPDAAGQGGRGDCRSACRSPLPHVPVVLVAVLRPFLPSRCGLPSSHHGSPFHRASAVRA